MSLLREPRPPADIPPDPEAVAREERLAALRRTPREQLMPGAQPETAPADVVRAIPRGTGARVPVPPPEPTRILRNGSAPLTLPEPSMHEVALRAWRRRRGEYGEGEAPST